MSVVAPRIRCLINGQDITTRTPNGSLQIGCVELFVTTTNYGRGDSFSATIVCPNTGAPPAWADPAAGITQVEATLQAALLPQGASSITDSAWNTLIVGLIDHVALDPIAGKIEIAGRDYSSLLIDLQVQEGWLNQRSGEVVALLAQNAGLTANVQDQGGITGQYYQIGHKRSALAAGHRFTTAWQVIRYLADVEGCDAYVTGKTLNFVPQLSNTAAAFSVALTRSGSGLPTLPAMSLRLERDLLMAKGVVVQVISWESRARRAHKSFWSAKGGSATEAASAETQGTLYTYKFPGLTADAAEQKAQELYGQIVAHQRTATLEIPLEFALTARQAVAISGTGTNWDGQQRVDSLTREIGWDAAHETIVLRNRDVTEEAGQ